MLLMSCGVGALFRPRNPGLVYGSGGELLEIHGIAESYMNETAIAWLKATTCSYVPQFVDCILNAAGDA